MALDKVCYAFQYGTSTKSQPTGKVAVLRMGNIQNGRIDWTDLVYTSDQTEIKQYLLAPGTVLFNRTNSPELVGKTGIYRGEQPAIFAGYLIKIDNCEALDSEYLNCSLNSNYAKGFCLAAKTDGVSQSNINAQKLGKFEIPFCGIAEQREIARRIESLFQVADRIEGRYGKAKAYADKLTQSILAKAFRGELVPQDPKDEPASKLLERIRAERETSKNEKGSRNRQASTRKRTKRRKPEAPKAPEVSTVQVSSTGQLERAPNRFSPGKPARVHTASIEALETNKIMAAFRKAYRGRGAMSREELIKEVSQVLGYSRLGAAIDEPLKGHLRAAMRRGIVEANGNSVNLATTTIEDYDRALLVQAMRSVMRAGKRYGREEVIRMAAEYLGFSRLTQNVVTVMRSTIRAAIRQGDIVSDRDVIWRI